MLDPEAMDTALGITNPSFDFSLKADEAEFLYRLMNLIDNSRESLEFEDWEISSVERFRARILDFTQRHPVRYGS